MNSDCIFCDIAQGKIKSSIVLENDGFIAIENINPEAPVHILVMPKEHIKKKDAISGKVNDFWNNLVKFAYQVIQKYELDKTGYRLVNNGAGYNDIDHEHFHILGGKNWKPKDNL